MGLVLSPGLFLGLELLLWFTLVIMDVEDATPDDVPIVPKTLEDETRRGFRPDRQGSDWLKKLHTSEFRERHREI